MATCNDCNQEMSDEKTTTCPATHIIIKGIMYKRNTEYHDVNERCHDCNIINGGVHHYGCDIERCPACGGQLISCDCNSAGDIAIVQGVK